MAGPAVSVITEKGGHRIVVVIDGRRLELPPLEHLAFYAVLGVLVAVNVVELAAALVAMAGHMLIEVTKHPGLHAVAEALEEA
jgi:hypothetical protein